MAIQILNLAVVQRYVVEQLPWLHRTEANNVDCLVSQAVYCPLFGSPYDNFEVGQHWLLLVCVLIQSYCHFEFVFEFGH